MRLDRGKGLMVCDYCRTEAVPPMGEDGVRITGETNHPCPVCKGRTLAEGLIEGEELLYCQGCRGMLVAMDRFFPLVEHLRAMRERPALYLSRRNPLDANRGLACPLCQQEMEAYPYGGPGNVHIDSCTSCVRLWLDASELQRIVTAPDAVPLYSRYDPGGDFEAR
jgi:Zn-finger nucleic acid-binding protein